MATDTIPRQEFLIRNLQTRSVTLYPTKAQIIRDINGISLKPGPNQVIIEGLTPTVDEQSIKVDGTGAATVTDMSVEIVPNKEVYEDIYPSDDEEDESSDNDALESDLEDDAIKAINKRMKEIRLELEDVDEIKASGKDRLEILSKHADSVSEKRPDKLDEFLEDFRIERAKLFEELKSANSKSEELEERMKSLMKERDPLLKAAAKAQSKLWAEKKKKLDKKNRKKEEIRKEKERIRAERSKYWPKKVYKVIISIEGPSGHTPDSSRRGSIDSLVKVSSPSKNATQSETSNIGEINLSLSYITYSASWSPRYDLNLNTVTNSGVIDYCAELRNTTSETWKDTKVVLSTSQTSYQGLGDTIPILQPWHVRLVKGYGNKGGSMRNASDAIYSKFEQDQKVKNRSEIPAKIIAPRSELFGVEKRKGGDFDGAYPQWLGNQIQQQMPQQMQQQMQQQVHMSMALPSAPTRSIAHQPPIPMPSSTTFGSRLAPKTLSMATPLLGSGSYDEATRESDGTAFGGGGASYYSSTEEDDATIMTPDPALLFEESSFSDSGMTTTYDLPSLKTISPSSSTTKHKIARIDFKSVVFSHIIIPKLKPAAYLKARIRNASKIALLKGTAGLTLDGSFLGQSTIPRCSAGDSFTLPLGVDPTISVAYLKPTVRRSQSGIFNKEDCEVFTRTAIVTNTKHNGPVDLLVLDQVPVSEDERLRIEIVTPRGLKVGGDSIRTGQGLDTATGSATADVHSSASSARMSIYGDNGTKASGSGSVKDSGSWGSATAIAKKGGEVNWNIRINPSRGCKLVLEYEAIYPGGETVVGID